MTEVSIEGKPVGAQRIFVMESVLEYSASCNALINKT